MVLWNVSDVKIEHCKPLPSGTVRLYVTYLLNRGDHLQVSIVQPPLWSLNIMNGTDIWVDDLYVNATALDAPYGKNWVQNTDGFDTMDARNVMLTNYVYQGTSPGTNSEEREEIGY